LEDRYDLANLLEVSESHLRFHLYAIDKEKRYTSFRIPKKSGKTREIQAPVKELKILQKKLNAVFKLIYKPKFSTHGFTQDKSIITNAQLHIKQNCLLNIDLEDFFPSINFGRVRGLLRAKPYACNEEIATMIANLCTHKNQLPQGAPTSPILSNMICASLDSALQRLSKKHKCLYSRYADDITFSTALSEFPKEIVYFSEEDKKVCLGSELLDIISNNGFKINHPKTRLRTNKEHQEVTGIVVNEKLNLNRTYIRKVRAMLHAWEKYGLENAQSHFLNKYYINPGFQKECPPFQYVLRGKIEFIGRVRGKDDYIYKNFLHKLKRLSPELVPDSLTDILRKYNDSNLEKIVVEIWTEGKTDIKHLRAALRRLDPEHFVKKVKLDFKDDLNPQQMGDKKLLQSCETLCKTKHEKIIIAIFDRDVPDTLKNVSGKEREFKDWKNNVYSFAIPTPPHRSNEDGVCIELYYSDDELMRKDELGRRLFLNTEFNFKSGRHKELDLNTLDRNSLGKKSGGMTKIIDDEVFNGEDKNVALTKDAFADNVLDDKKNFSNFDFYAFEAIFDIIRDIVIFNLDNKTY
jgi:RNA-directed DNA polymerase